MTSSALAAGECSNDSAYDKACGSLSIYPSYECAIDTAGVSSACKSKASRLIGSCENSVLKFCDTAANDSGNKYELCLAENTESSSCKSAAMQYA